MKWVGAVLVVLSCSSCGMMMAAAYRREEVLLRQLREIMEWMACELRCRATDLPCLFLRATQRTQGPLGTLFDRMSTALSGRVEPDAMTCMETALRAVCLPGKVRQIALQLGASLGEFHLEGQVRQLEAVGAECSRLLEEHVSNRDSRLRTYRTMGVCGGLALAILLL